MLYPLNNYLVVQLLEEEKTESGVIIPEDVVIINNPFRLVKITEPHANSNLKKNMHVLVPTHMIEEASFFGKTYYLITENHVVGFYEE